MGFVKQDWPDNVLADFPPKLSGHTQDTGDAKNGV